MFTNLKIRVKLIVGFAIMMAFAVVVGVIGIIGMRSLDKSITAIVHGPADALYYATKMESTLNSIQTQLFKGINAVTAEDDTAADEVAAELSALDGEFLGFMEEYAAAAQNDSAEEKALYDALQSSYAAMDSHINVYEEALAANDLADATEAREAVSAALPDAVADTDDIVRFSQESMLQEEKDTTTFANTMALIQIGALVVSAVLAVILTFIIAKAIAAPSRKLAAAARRIAQGEVKMELDIKPRKDEIGELADSFREMTAGFVRQAETLDAIAGGDYSVTIVPSSGHDVVGHAIVRILDNSNEMMHEIRTAAEQVAAGATQIADGASSLATGSTQQAATVEELSASITQVQSQAEDNTTLANKTAAEVNEAGQLMGESLDHMKQLTEAMHTIDSSSQEISKVIKVIDDIAFQTNILALNAAVEAARAGQHGKGFAVVADEVRNLASKSSAAAKETASLIENSAQNVQKGNEIVELTGQSLSKMGEIASGNAVAMQTMSEASTQQSTAITEITQGITQISQVVQANSATSQQSAASAEELSAQSTMLNKTVSRFKLRGIEGGAPLAALPEATGEEPASFESYDSGAIF